MTDLHSIERTPELHLPAVDPNFYLYDATTISSKGLIIIDDQLLVYRRGPEAPTHPLCLDVPGGRTEEGETPFQTYQREVKEEFGLDISADSIVWARRYNLPNEAEKSVYFSVASLPGVTIHDVNFGDEGIEYMLMTPDEFLSQADVHRPFLDRAKEYFDHQRAPGSAVAR